jgi:hypothetical protein
MKYAIKINKHVKYLQTYTILKKIGAQDNFLTKLFIKVFNKKQKDEGMPI